MSMHNWKDDGQICFDEFKAMFLDEESVEDDYISKNSGDDIQDGKLSNFRAQGKLSTSFRFKNSNRSQRIDSKFVLACEDKNIMLKLNESTR